MSAQLLRAAIAVTRRRGGPTAMRGPRLAERARNLASPVGETG